MADIKYKYDISDFFFLVYLQRSITFKVQILTSLISLASVFQHERTQQSGASLSKQSRYELFPVNDLRGTNTQKCAKAGIVWLTL